MWFILHNTSLLMKLLMMQPKLLAGTVAAARPLGVPSHSLLLHHLISSRKESGQGVPLWMEVRPAAVAR